jgi:hypothetical protein
MLRFLRSPLPIGSEGSSGSDARPKPGVICVLYFPDSVEERWFEKPPTAGTRLHSHRLHYQDGRWYAGMTWVVDDVVVSGDRFRVFCVGRSEYLDRRRRSSDGRLALAVELLDVARHTREVVSERRRRWKAWLA